MRGVRGIILALGLLAGACVDDRGPSIFEGRWERIDVHGAPTGEWLVLDDEEGLSSSAGRAENWRIEDTEPGDAYYSLITCSGDCSMETYSHLVLEGDRMLIGRQAQMLWLAAGSPPGAPFPGSTWLGGESACCANGSEYSISIRVELAADGTSVVVRTPSNHMGPTTTRWEGTWAEAEEGVVVSTGNGTDWLRVSDVLGTAGYRRVGPP